uniref:40S ribosomal protein S25 n=1 Tax=Steinernema glaseri TaxID=37863 RepID=A0A1I7Y7H2_9BILA
MPAIMMSFALPTVANGTALLAPTACEAIVLNYKSAYIGFPAFLLIVLDITAFCPEGEGAPLRSLKIVPPCVDPPLLLCLMCCADLRLCPLVQFSAASEVHAQMAVSMQSLQAPEQLPCSSKDSHEDVFVHVITKNKEVVILSLNHLKVLPNIYSRWKIQKKKRNAEKNTVCFPTVKAEHLLSIRDLLDHVRTGAHPKALPAQSSNYTAADLHEILGTLNLLGCDTGKLLKENGYLPKNV